MLCHRGGSDPPPRPPGWPGPKLMSYTADEIARHLEGKVFGDGSVRIVGFAPADRAKPGDLTFAENPAYFARAEASAAAAILVDSDFRPGVKALIRVPNALVAFARILPLFFPDHLTFPAGRELRPGAMSACLKWGSHSYCGFMP